jgi:pimeloyl-ACP methyl ester carboxylesterase
LQKEFVAGIRCPVLGLFGEADTVTPVAVARALAASVAMREKNPDEVPVDHPVRTVRKVVARRQQRRRC